ncbi:hypothetical protein AKO1_006773 [Acrasis kona]|uniref:Uncharacterized protein n=1 Tax=Acrasis kona TaxID=1008807 RepID=A0AAW2ZNE9_9EUKA
MYSDPQFQKKTTHYDWSHPLMLTLLPTCSHRTYQLVLERRVSRLVRSFSGILMRVVYRQCFKTPHKLLKRERNNTKTARLRRAPQHHV